MKTCQWQHPDDYCFNLVEGRTDYCARHNRLIRKMATDEQKAEEKRKALLSKPKKIYAKPNKVSEKMRDIQQEYLNLRAEYLAKHPTCEAKISPQCGHFIMTIHHKRGRGKYLLDTNTWLACCMSCHVLIESNPHEAKERGFSESRLAKQEPHKI